MGVPILAVENLRSFFAIVFSFLLGTTSFFVVDAKGIEEVINDPHRMEETIRELGLDPLYEALETHGGKLRQYLNIRILEVDSWASAQKILGLDLREVITTPVLDDNIPFDADQSVKRFLRISDVLYHSIPKNFSSDILETNFLSRFAFDASFQSRESVKKLRDPANHLRLFYSVDSKKAVLVYLNLPSKITTSASTKSSALRKVCITLLSRVF